MPRDPLCKRSIFQLARHSREKDIIPLSYVSKRSQAQLLRQARLKGGLFICDGDTTIIPPSRMTPSNLELNIGRQNIREGPMRTSLDKGKQVLVEHAETEESSDDDDDPLVHGGASCPLFDKGKQVSIEEAQLEDSDGDYDYNDPLSSSDDDDTRPEMMQLPHDATEVLLEDVEEQHETTPVTRNGRDNPVTEIPLCRNFLGRMEFPCKFCGALHWKDERVQNSKASELAFSKCCKGGLVVLPALQELPSPLKKLYYGDDSNARSFRKHIRQYNACNAFTSLGANINDRVIKGTGPPSFTVHGELRHRTGSLLPEPGKAPQYAQLYIYDPSSALDFRLLRNKNLSKEVLQILQTTLLEHNNFIQLYQSAYETLHNIECEGGTVQNPMAYLHYKAGTDRRRYNLPSADEIAVVVPGDGTEVTDNRDIVLHLKGGKSLMRISEQQPSYLPLHYVLLFPRGELGWSEDLRHWDRENKCPRETRVSQLQYFAYRLFEREGDHSVILDAGRLFEEFVCDGWLSTEQNKMNFIKLNQQALRCDVYKGLTDIADDNLTGKDVGRRTILPSSFMGSARHMYEMYQDSMAIARHYRNPDLFVTVTANPKWPEIINELKKGQTAQSRPDLVVRVYEMKRRAILDQIVKNGIMGKCVGRVMTTEFQKRGLPHMHALIFLHGDDKLNCAEDIDEIVSAEIPDPVAKPHLFKTVLNCMVHGPCGARNPNSPCMDKEKNKCSKHYPRKFQEATNMDSKGYPLYRRRDNGKSYKKGVNNVDNRDVVPYNSKLSEMFDCHINVEVCSSIRAVKYIHKYIYKGHDRATLVFDRGTDECQEYIDARYVSPPEALWRLYKYQLHQEKPSVQRLALHLPGMHMVYYNKNEPVECILARARTQQSTLTNYFKRCEEDESARNFTYQEFPQFYTHNSKNKAWSPRVRGFAIGRMYFASPNAGERFYLRLLLTVVKGARSFEYLRTVNGVLHATFKEACIARGLLEDDSEWSQCLEEARVMQTGYQLRRLFCVILSECAPTKPDELWNQFAKYVCDDLEYKLRTVFTINDPSQEQVEDYGLFLLNEMLRESGRSLEDFPPMPLPQKQWNIVVGNPLINEHQRYRYEIQPEVLEDNIARLNPEQKTAFETVTESVLNCTGKLFFLNGSAGTGKTFVYNTIASSIRSQGHIVVMVASSGISALLLDGGRTAHSTFKIPFEVNETSVCGFTKQSLSAALFRQTKLIIWDEITMQHKYCVEAVDRSLRDITDIDKPFGGITVVFGGDFRQTLPVVPKAGREQIVSASLRRSFLWSQVEILCLVQNMRLEMDVSENVSYASFLEKVGSSPQETVEFPPEINLCTNIDDLINSVYPNLSVEGTATPKWITERTILAARNTDVDIINDAALAKFPGDPFTHYSGDKILDDETGALSFQYPTEYLNVLNIPGLPPSKLCLKKGTPIMMLRNFAPKDGLCNGTRLVVVRSSDKIIEAEILTGPKTGDKVFIPRLKLVPSNGDIPFRMQRIQFPIRPAYAMTINKSQGQSVKYIGINLRTPVFSHGQLYVAMSRCTSARRITVLTKTNTETSGTTTNIVYPEVLLPHLTHNV